MQKTNAGLLILLLLLALVGAWWLLRESGAADVRTLRHDARGRRLRVAILGTPTDARIPAVHEALEHWNSEFQRLGRQVHFDSAIVRNDSIPDALLRSASGEAVLGGGPATRQLFARIDSLPADVVIALSQADLISFSVRWRAGSMGVVGLRRSDIPPLSLPNTVRNVVAHELGHTLGLNHNSDSTTLMCGRPAPCRPASFASERARFFPLTASEERRLQDRWP